VNFDPAFIQTNFSSFGASVHQVNFGDTKKVVGEINSTIAKQTNNKIQNLMPEGSISPDVRIVLTNAVYFKDSWAKVFKKEETRESDFHSSTEKTVKAMFMHQKGHFNSFEDEVVSVLELPFNHENYSLLILLPKIGIDEFESDFFNAETYSTWKFESWNFSRILIPRFKAEQETEPKSILQKFGMQLVFREGEADLSGITNEQSLAISGIFHKAYIEVNEEGAEAAAATGAVAELRGLNVPHQFIADRPFIFLIRENHSESILFIGKLIDP
jgi:serpin B